MDEVIRPVQGVGIYVILRVQDRITSSVSGLVLQGGIFGAAYICLLYTSDAADER